MMPSFLPNPSSLRFFSLPALPFLIFSSWFLLHQLSPPSFFCLNIRNPRYFIAPSTTPLLQIPPPSLHDIGSGGASDFVAFFRVDHDDSGSFGTFLFQGVLRNLSRDARDERSQKSRRHRGKQVRVTISLRAGNPHPHPGPPKHANILR